MATQRATASMTTGTNILMRTPTTRTTPKIGDVTPSGKHIGTTAYLQALPKEKGAWRGLGGIASSGPVAA
jgi:hypothetical protein